MDATTSLLHQLHILYRRKWVLLAFVVIVPVVVGVLSSRQSKSYSASAEVLLSNTDLAGALAGVSNAGSTNFPDRSANTQAGLARVPAVAARVIRATRTTGMSASDFLANSSVKSETNSDLLRFTVSAPTPALAQRLATAYAQQYTVYKQGLDTAALRKALSDVTTQLNQLRNSGKTSGIYSTLLRTQQSLRTMTTLQTANAVVVREATGASQVRPRLKRDTALGLVFGLALGIAFAFLVNALDTRISEEEIDERVNVPLLGRIAKPPARIRRANSLVMLEEPADARAEAFRILRTNLDFVLLAHPAGVLMVTSTVESEGKSPTAANLALAYAHAGKRVILVDLDLRRPAVARLFSLRLSAGLSDVALGQVALERALVPISPDARGALSWGVEGWRADETNGIASLQVLASGVIPPNPAEFVGSGPVRAIIAKLREEADLVIVDAPPLLAVSDALVISTFVDGIVLCVRKSGLARKAFEEAIRILGTCPAPKLGYVLIDAEVESSYYRGYGSRRADERVDIT
jgi:succinoglycan biosynthesis transport protein ExoP